VTQFFVLFYLVLSSVVSGSSFHIPSGVGKGKIVPVLK
jgi:hypothetical protein